MSNQLKIATRKAFARAPGLVGAYPCFQSVAEGAFLFDRAGGTASNGVFGGDLSAAAAWANANRLTLADNVVGNNAGCPYIPGATLNWALATESLIVAGVVNIAAAPAATRHILGNGSSTTIRGFTMRYNLTTGYPSILAHGAATLFGTASATSIATGADVHICMAIDGPRSRALLYIGGVYDTTANGGTEYVAATSGLNFSAQTANMEAQCLTNPFMIGGQPNTGVYALRPTSQSYGWQIAKRTGNLPSNISDIVKRLARHPTQPLSSQEWPA